MTVRTVQVVENVITRHFDSSVLQLLNFHKLEGHCATDEIYCFFLVFFCFQFYVSCEVIKVSVTMKRHDGAQYL